MDFQDLLAQNGGFGGQNKGRGGTILAPSELVHTFEDCYFFATFGGNRSRSANVRVWTDIQTDGQTQTHALTDTNSIYDLSHAICYSYGADNNATAYTLMV